MSRSKHKGAFVDEKLLMKVQVAKKKNDRAPIKTWSRRSTVTPDFVGVSFSVHNGHKFQTIFITENMVGYKLGEFAPTRTFRKHGGVKAKKAAELT